jgi:hypothetical protein
VSSDRWPVKRGEDKAEFAESAEETQRRENKSPGAKPAPGAPDEEIRERAAESRPLFLGFGVVGVGFYFFDLVGVAFAVGGD